MPVIIPDVHGQYYLLRDALEFISVTYPDELVIFAGDLIDRGPHSPACLELAKRWCENGKAALVLGNHEEMMLTALRQFDTRGTLKGCIWFGAHAAGQGTFRQYAEEAGHTDPVQVVAYIRRLGHEAFLRNRSLGLYETDELLVTHAPIPASAPDDWRAKDDGTLMRWAHPNYKPEDVFAKDHGKLAVCGHVSNRHGPRIYPHIVYLDGGCGYPGASLTILAVVGGQQHYHTFSP